MTPSRWRFAIVVIVSTGSTIADVASQDFNTVTIPVPDSLTAEIYKNVLNHAFPRRTAIWQQAGIPVCWENMSDGSPADRQLVQKAVADTWEAFSKVKFTGWAQCVLNNKGIRVVIEDKGWLPMYAPRTLYLGNLNDGKPNAMRLNFTFKKWGPTCSQNGEAYRQTCIRSTAIHEFGHALGFAHEQNRDDTPKECRTKQGPSGDNGDDIDLTPWDPASVMNYCRNIYVEDLQLSNLDKYALQTFYGKP